MNQIFPILIISYQKRYAHKIIFPTNYSKICVKKSQPPKLSITNIFPVEQHNRFLFQKFSSDSELFYSFENCIQDIYYP